MSKKLIYLAFIVNVLNLEVCKMYSIRKARKVSLFRDLVLAVFLSVVGYMLMAMPAAYAGGGYALEVGGGGTVTIDDDKDVLRLGSYTYEFWMKDLQGPIGSWRNVFYKGAGNSSWGRGPLLSLRPNEPGLHFDHSTGTGQSTVNTYEGIPVNEWIHVAIVLTALNGEQIIYQAGVQAAVISGVNLTDATQPSVLQMGVGANIVLDDFRVWNYARTQAEIQEDMNYELRGSEEGLVGYWKFDEGEGTTAYDSSPNQNHGTIAGAIWTKDAAPVVPPPAFAYDPSPANGVVDVPRDVVLSWKPGIFAPPVDGHTVYFDESFNDVNDGIGGIIQSANSYTLPLRLDFATTYYWRIDEVNNVNTDSPWIGKVWSFTTELFVYPIENLTATASSSSRGNRPESTVDGSGLDANNLHSTEGWAMWLSSTEPNGAWIEYEFDKVYKLYEMWVWNSNQTIETLAGFGLKDVTVEYSTNGTDWTTLAGVPQFAQAPGTAGYAHNTTVDLAGVPAKYVRLTANSNFGGTSTQYGLSEVRFFRIPVNAREPNATDGATDVSIGTIDAPVDVTLGFYAGREAAKHEVYFSTDEQAVIDGTAAVTTVSERSYGPLSLDLGETYYWRVDEVNEAETPTTWQGDIWDFKTQEYFVLDDFESYNDLDPTDPESNRIFLAWMDGYDVPTNGSLVGYAEAPFAERGIVHGGSQSMPLFYDNTAAANYSQAQRAFSPAQDWTRKGIGALSLWFRGYPAPVGSFVEAPAGTYTMTGAGADIYGASDEFHFAYKELSGAGTIIAKVESVENTDPWAKAGVMIRDTLESDSRNVSLLVTPENGVRFQYRNTAGGITDRYFAEGITAPQWVRLERTTGGLVRAYYSADGTAWTLLNMTVVSMNMPVYIGLAVTSHNVDATCEAKFSNVSFPDASVGPQWTDQDVGMLSNEAEPMYVTVGDGSGTAATVYHDDPDATLLDTWTEWNIDLKEFGDVGVVLTDVSKLAIGFGGADNPQPGGSGLTYFDDIRLYPLAP
jgi:hypothetical protein